MKLWKASSIFKTCIHLSLFRFYRPDTEYLSLRHIYNTLNSVENFAEICTFVLAPAFTCSESQIVFWKLIVVRIKENKQTACLSTTVD
jgi:hypothetical protein